MTTTTEHPGTITTSDARRTGSVRRVAAVASALAVIASACGGGGDDSSGADAEPTGSTLPPDARTIVDTAATAMGDVTSVQFELRRGGAPVFIDSFGSIALNDAIGQFEVPGSAQAVLEVEVDGALTTELGAIALDDEIWLSNPITGRYETLPIGYDIDPSLFFDPENGWEPLLAGLRDVELLGLVERDGNERYHVRGTATAEQVAIITANLVRGQDVEIDFWLQPVTGRVRAAEFTTSFGGDDVEWTLVLERYGDDFDISAPDDVDIADAPSVDGAIGDDS